MIDIIVSLLLLTAFLLVLTLLGSYHAYLREVKLTRELYRLSKQNEFESLYEDEYMAEWQAKSGEDFIWN